MHGQARRPETERARAAGEILLLRNCITGIRDITIVIVGLAGSFSLSVRETFLVTSSKVKSVKCFEENRI